MKSTFKLVTYCILALSISLISCSAEDGQDGIPGKDGVAGEDGTPGRDGTDGTGAIDLGWSSAPSTTRTKEQEAIFIGLEFENSQITAAQLETFGFFSYVRSATAPDPKFALPTSIVLGDENITYDISFGGIDGTELFFIIQREDGAPIPVDAVIPDLQFKTILIPSTPAGKRAIASGKFLN